MDIPAKSDAPNFIQVVERELENGNLVVLLGGPCSGKSWLIAQIFDNEDVIDKSTQALAGNQLPIDLCARDKWSARTKKAVAVDEAQLLDQSAVLDVITMSASCQTGVVIASQQQSLIPNQVISSFLENGKKAVFIKMEFWEQEISMPKWRIKEVIS